MSRIGERQIETLAIVDDDEDSRASMVMCVGDSQFKPYSVDGPLTDVKAAHRSIASRAQGCICDHRLQVQGHYARFSGAELAAWNNQHDLPSILCTRFLGSDDQMPIIRGFLKDLPVLLKPEQMFEPDEITAALRACISELSGSISPQRRSWRTQVVVEQIDSKDRTVSVSLPAWQIDDPVRVRLADIPSSLQDMLGVGNRMFVRANIGESNRDFVYIDWQSS